MLAEAGVDASVLECGAHWPYREAFQREMAARGETPGALHDNCSGKHAGFICLACHRAGATPLFDFAKGYVQASHPVMREVDAGAADRHRLGPVEGAAGIDGCSIPTFGIPLQHLARAFARVGTGVGLGADEARPRGACARRWRRHRSWWPAPTASTRA